MDVHGSALVIGAASGIGRDACIAYAIEGVRALVIADIDLIGAEETAKQCHAASRRYEEDLPIHVLRVDVLSEESVQDLVREAAARLGRVDYCVNSAGVGQTKAAEMADASTADLERLLQINVRGTFLILKAVSALMKMQEITTIPSRTTTVPREVGRGVIIVLGSCNSYVATPQIVQYTAAKHAVLGMTKNAALDNAPHKIRVNAVCPAWVDTPMVDEAIAGTPGLKNIMERVVPLGRIALREEVSDAIMFLSSARASFITGSGLLVDGGATLQLQI